MRVLLVDAGNSALKWAVADATAPAWQPHGAAAAVHTMGWDEAALGAALVEALRAALAAGGGRFGLVAGSLVAGRERAAQFEAALRAAGGPAVNWFDAAARFEHDGLRVGNAYRDPARLGPDRWHALIGARSFAPGRALAVVHAGTATVVDALDPAGNFLGGVIAPGLGLMRTALAEATALLPLAGGAYAPHPDSTDDAIRTGLLDAQLGLIERRLRRIRLTTGGPVRLLVGGGHARELLALLRTHLAENPIEHAPDLVLRGLWHRARAALSAEAAHAAP